MDSNLVTFKTTKDLEDEDAEIILLYLENKRSGGGEIEKLEVESNKRIVHVHFKQQEDSERIKQLKKIQFKLLGKDFTLDVTEPFENVKLDRVLCLKNLDDRVKSEDVELYAEYFALTNEINNIIISKFFKNTFFIEFKQPIDMDSIKERCKKYKNLFGKALETVECYETCSIIGKYEDLSKVHKEILDLHFTNQRRSGTNEYVSYKELNDNCFIIRFKDKNTVDLVSKRDHKIQNKILLVEKLFILPEEQS